MYVYSAELWPKIPFINLYSLLYHNLVNIELYLKILFIYSVIIVVVMVIVVASRLYGSSRKTTLDRMS